MTEFVLNKTTTSMKNELGSNVIGEGTYGCVHKPALHCINAQKTNYDNKISKIMFTENAENEMKEYDKVETADREEKYFLGKPHICNPENTEYNETSMMKCKNGPKSLRDAKLLIMRDGGENLQQYAPKINTTKKAEQFFLEAHKLFKGVKLFLDNNLIHYDLKPQNIVYNEKTGDIKFIDFGLMVNKQELIQKCKTNAIKPVFHWNYPPENGFINKRDYMKYAEDKRTLVEIFINDKNKSRSNFKKLVFRENPEITRRIEKDTVTLIKDDVTAENYNQFLEKSINTIDTYGLGLSLMNVLITCRHYFTIPLYDDMFEVFYGMIYPSVFNRLTIEDAMQRYVAVLKKHRLIDDETTGVKKPNKITMISTEFFNVDLSKKGKTKRRQPTKTTKRTTATITKQRKTMTKTQPPQQKVYSFETPPPLKTSQSNKKHNIERIKTTSRSTKKRRVGNTPPSMNAQRPQSTEKMSMSL